jgi:hypothetical protein
MPNSPTSRPPSRRKPGPGSPVVLPGPRWQQSAPQLSLPRRSGALTMGTALAHVPRDNPAAEDPRDRGPGLLGDSAGRRHAAQRASQAASSACADANAVSCRRDLIAVRTSPLMFQFLADYGCYLGPLAGARQCRACPIPRRAATESRCCLAWGALTTQPAYA